MAVKTRERLLAEIEVVEARIIQLRDDIKKLNNHVNYLQLRSWRKQKKICFSNLKKLKSDLEKMNQMNIFDT